MKTLLKTSIVSLIVQMVTMGQTQNFDLSSQDSTYKCKFCQTTIAEYTVEYGVEDLQTKEFQNGDFEVRIWTSVSNGRNVIFIKNNNDKKTIYSLDDLRNTSERLLDLIGLYNPKIELLDSNLVNPNYIWALLIKNDITILPDEREIMQNNSSLHGVLYIVEIGNQSGYRYYHYSNPDMFELKETKKMTRIIEILYNEILSKI